MGNFKRNLIQGASGFLGGYAAGGFWGGVTGGATAAATGGKAKPLKSIAIGAGSGLVGGTVAQRLGYQGGVTRVGPYSFRPLSSRLLSSLSPGGPVKSPGQKSISDKKVSLPRFGKAPSLDVTRPVFVPIGDPGVGPSPDGPLYASAGGLNTDLLLLAGGALFLAQSM